MSITEEQLELIVKHLEGNLGKTEKNTFDHLHESSEEFRKELKNTEFMLASLKVSDRMNRFQEVKQAFDEFEGIAETSSRSIKPYWMIGVAATVTLMVFGTLYWMNSGVAKNSQELYAQYFEVFPIEAGGARNHTEGISDGLGFYKSAEYSQAIPYLKELINADSSVVNKIYLANAYLKAGQPVEAESVLKKMVVTPLNSVYERYAKWYLSLALLAQNKDEVAQRYLKELAKSGGYFQVEAQEISEIID